MRDYLEAREGYILTNGEVYGKRIYLAQGLAKTNFTEITAKEYETILEMEAQTVSS